MKPEAEYLFEASWEVCNKVGGIYTVVKSKAFEMVEHYKNYFLIGPFFAEKAIDLDKIDPPEELKPVFTALEQQGLKCHFGEWSVDGSPKTILIDFKALFDRKDEFKKELWDSHKIDSLNARWDFEEPMLWSKAVAIFLCEFEKNLPGKKIVGQFHEWLAGLTILFLKNYNSTIRTVFTTHATMLGRCLAGSGDDLYKKLNNLNPDEEAYKYNIQEKFLSERAAANTANIFTTVSEITALEATKIFGRQPDVILNNGLTLRKFPTIEETSLKHIIGKNQIRQFLTYYFFPYYSFDLSHNLTFFIVGRYEFKNKGIDVFIKALGKLNEKLKDEHSKRTISAFFWIPIDHQGIDVKVLENKNSFMHIKNFVYRNSQDILEKTIMDIVSSKTPHVKNIFTKEFLKELEKDLRIFKRSGNPPLSTHIVSEHNSMISEFRKAGLNNQESDHVKVILFPVYLTGNDGLLNLSYYDAIAGSHLGVFPSYYEPWGYTPLETAALGVSAITTNLAGFGRFINKQIPDRKSKTRGIFVLDRFSKSDDFVVENLFKIFYNFCHLSHEDRVKNKMVAKLLANKADWKNFIVNYIQAHNLALQN